MLPIERIDQPLVNLVAEARTHVRADRVGADVACADGRAPWPRAACRASEISGDRARLVSSVGSPNSKPSGMSCKPFHHTAALPTAGDVSESPSATLRARSTAQGTRAKKRVGALVDRRVPGERRRQDHSAEPARRPRTASRWPRRRRPHAPRRGR